jgi:hypothetical protein
MYIYEAVCSYIYQSTYVGAFECVCVCCVCVRARAILCDFVRRYTPMCVDTF